MAIQHVSVDKFMFWVDDIEITGTVLSTNNIKLDKISIYPNPAKDYIVISNADEAIINIIDIKGKLVKSKISKTNKLSINTANLEAGIYFIKIINDTNVITKKIIIK